MKSKILIIAFLSLVSNTLSAQARLTIENNSMRSMTVKVMQGSSGKGTLHETVTIGAYGSETVYFSNSGYYFTKTKAVLQGKDPVYRKGQPFEVTNNSSGYGNLDELESLCSQISDLIDRTKPQPPIPEHN